MGKKKKKVPEIIRGEEYKLGEDKIVREYREVDNRKEWRLNYKDKVITPWFINETNAGEIAIGNNSLAVIGQLSFLGLVSLYKVTKDEYIAYEIKHQKRCFVPEYFIQTGNRTTLYAVHHAEEERRANFDFERFEANSREYIRTLIYGPAISIPVSYDSDEKPVEISELTTNDLPEYVTSRTAEAKAFLERYQPVYYIKTFHIDGIVKKFRGVKRNDGKVAGILQDLDTGEILHVGLKNGVIDDAALGCEIRKRMVKQSVANNELLYKLSSEVTRQIKKRKTVDIEDIKLNYDEIIDDNGVVYRTNLNTRMKMNFSPRKHHKFTDLIDPNSFINNNNTLSFIKLEEENPQSLRTMKASIKADGLIINVEGVVDSNNELIGDCIISFFKERKLAADDEALDDIANVDYANIRDYINLGIVSRRKIKSDINPKAPKILVKFNKDQL